MTSIDRKFLFDKIGKRCTGYKRKPVLVIVDPSMKLVGLAVTCGSGFINSFGDYSLAGNLPPTGPPFTDSSPPGNMYPLK
jgi:hypothetical protein